MMIMLDNPHAVDSQFIISLNTGADSALTPTAFDYGDCSAKYSYLHAECQYSSSTCRGGYKWKNFYAGSLTCACTCCMGGLGSSDCGTNQDQMYV